MERDEEREGGRGKERENERECKRVSERSLMDLAGHGKIRKFSSDCFLLFSKLKSQVISSEVKGVSRENVRFPRREEEGMKYFSHMVES